MGIVNVTADSFSDGGRFLQSRDAIAHGLQLLDEGADWLDIGGESTRPGSLPVSAEAEKARVVPVIAGILRERPQAVISIDTQKADVAEAAVAVGATIVNDVSALHDPDMAPFCARARVGLVLMHMRGVPRSMQDNTDYDDLIGEIVGFLRERTAQAEAAGIERHKLFVDPGLGFGKSLADNPVLIASASCFRELGLPVVIGASRKRFIGDLTKTPTPDSRVFGSIGAALAAAAHGAAVLRVHDVQATRQALQVFWPCWGGTP
ncbi:MAG: dihydropteroate synthase [Proteobacteria bacterium]|jgi:dihydropteroate synthase|nr:dihydropteroate synthase [Pseudomonadota bacterium]